ncbi:hypothetical protein GCM10023340_21750 [Nocardioides marinquilinus]|uniref:Uncharacterized protein n=1 Tax=Nocardioides marinquilinus TaxID=1210400 RepID=A0ABP9PN80_9ACTN
MSEQAGPVPSEEERREIEEERQRRLDPANRPERAEVDNTGVTLPAVEEFERQVADDDEASAGTADPTADPTAGFREQEVDEDERREIEEERARRLDPANRPENTEVDNTGRTFEGDRFVD